MVVTAPGGPTITVVIRQGPMILNCCVCDAITRRSHRVCANFIRTGDVFRPGRAASRAPLPLSQPWCRHGRLCGAAMQSAEPAHWSVHECRVCPVPTGRRCLPSAQSGSAAKVGIDQLVEPGSPWSGRNLRLHGDQVRDKRQPQEPPANTQNDRPAGARTNPARRGIGALGHFVEFV